MKKCCLYQVRTGEKYVICTTDDNCPEIDDQDGSKLVGSWGVDDCDECRIKPVCDEEKDPSNERPDPPRRKSHS